MRETPGFPWVMFFFSGFPGVFFDIFYRLLIVISYFRNCRGRAFSGISHDIPMISHSFHDFPHSFPPLFKGNPWANSRQGAAGWQRRRRRGRRPWWRWSGRPSTWTSPPGEWRRGKSMGKSSPETHGFDQDGGKPVSTKLPRKSIHQWIWDDGMGWHQWDSSCLFNIN